MQYSAVQCNAMQCEAMQSHAMEYNTVICTVLTIIGTSEPPRLPVEIDASMSTTKVTFAMVLRLFNCAG